MGKYFLYRLNIFANTQVNFRVMGKEGETLSRMYDDQRECLISALPTRCYKVRNMGERGIQFDVRLLTFMFWH